MLVPDRAPALTIIIEPRTAPYRKCHASQRPPVYIPNVYLTSFYVGVLPGLPGVCVCVCVGVGVGVGVGVWVCARVRVCMRALVRACVHACVRVEVRENSEGKGEREWGS